MPEVLLMRHGRVHGHEVKRFLGRTDAPLDDHGRAQCAWWRGRMPEPAEVWCSPLSRARESAAIIAGNASVRVLGHLREIDLGEWDGRAMHDVKDAEPHAFAERGRHLDTFRPPGGESFSDVALRAGPILNELADRLQGASGPILVTAHAGINRVLLCLGLGLPMANLFRLQQDYACLNRLGRKNGQWVLRSLNETPPKELP